MKLKDRVGQLRNQLERLEDKLTGEDSVMPSEFYSILLEMAEIRVRIKEVEFLLGDLTKNFSKL